MIRNAWKTGLAGAALLMLLAAPAHAAGGSCSYDPATKKVSYSLGTDGEVYIQAMGAAPTGGISVTTAPQGSNTAPTPVQCMSTNPVVIGATVTNTDTIEPAGSTGFLHINLAYPLGPGFTNEGDGSSEIEILVGDSAYISAVIGSSGNDEIYAGSRGINLNADETTFDVDVRLPGGGGSFRTQSFLGGEGNDTISTRGGGALGFEVGLPFENPVIEGGPGNDTIYAGGRGSFHGGPGDDKLNSQGAVAMFDDASSGVTIDQSINGPQPIGGGLGSDTIGYLTHIVGSQYPDVIDGEGWIEGKGGDDELSGSGFGLKLEGGTGEDTITGGDGADLLIGGDQNDELSGGDGEDLLEGNAGNDQLTGGDDDDLLIDDEGSETADAGSGDDMFSIEGGIGSDSLDGGAGEDMLYFGTGDDGNVTTGVTVDLAVTGVQNTVGAGSDVFHGIEDVYGSSYADTIRGDDGPNELVGDNSEWGMTLGPYPGPTDLLDGRGGDDYLHHAQGNADNPVTLIGGSGDDSIESGPWPNKIDGGPGDDYLEAYPEFFGDSFHDEIDGGPGSDMMLGFWGDDTLIGFGDGTVDFLDCGDDSDTAVVDKGIDETFDCETLQTPAPAGSSGTTPPAPAQASLSAKKVIALPSSKKRQAGCARGARKLRITVKSPDGISVNDFTVRVGAKKTKHKGDGSLRVRVPRGRFDLGVTVHFSDGRSVSSSKGYARCKSR